MDWFMLLFVCLQHICKDMQQKLLVFQIPVHKVFFHSINLTFAMLTHCRQSQLDVLSSNINRIQSLHATINLFFILSIKMYVVEPTEINSTFFFAFSELVTYDSGAIHFHISHSVIRNVVKRSAFWMI